MLSSYSNRIQHLFDIPIKGSLGRLLWEWKYSYDWCNEMEASRDWLYERYSSFSMVFFFTNFLNFVGFLNCFDCLSRWGITLTRGPISLCKFTYIDRFMCMLSICILLSSFGEPYLVYLLSFLFWIKSSITSLRFIHLLVSCFWVWWNLHYFILPMCFGLLWNLHYFISFYRCIQRGILL